MRFLLALILVLGIAFQTMAQSPTPSGTVPVPSLSNTIPTPAAPINLRNQCLGHIITFCPAWDPPTTLPAGLVYNRYIVYYSLQGSGVATSVTVLGGAESTKITNLVANSLYDVWVQGYSSDFNVHSFNSSIVIFQTDPQDPVLDPSLGISNFACAQGTNPSTGRVAIICSWTAAIDTVVQINLKCECTSTVREPVSIRKNLYGTRATATSALLAINRDIATCNVHARFYYTRRPGTRHFVQLNIFD
jgi:hypothetical protein